MQTAGEDSIFPVNLLEVWGQYFAYFWGEGKPVLKRWQPERLGEVCAGRVQ